MTDRPLRRISIAYALVIACLYGALLFGTLGAVSAHAAAPIIPPPPEIAATSYLLIDATSKEVLVEHNANEQNPPASLTKIMTSYLAEQEISAGRISPQDEVLVSVNAWRTGAEAIPAYVLVAS